jgi:NAD-reducing hydrogenase large subunit
VLLRKFGQEVIRITAGKRVHGTGAVPGGVNRALSRAERDEPAGRDLPDHRLEPAGGATRRGCTPPIRRSTTLRHLPLELLSLVGADGVLDFYDGVLRARDADGGCSSTPSPGQGLPALIREEVKPWSYMKFPFLTALGPEEGWYKVGPLARVQNCDPSDAAGRGRAARVHRPRRGKPIHAPLAYHWARMIEMLHAAETIKDLLHDDDLSGAS